MSDSPNRIEQITVANAETNARLAPASPTGKTIIPPAWVPYLTVLGLVAAVPMAVAGGLAGAGLAVPVWLTVASGIGASISGLLAVVGIVSPGLRRQG